MTALEKMARAWWDIRETTMPERTRQRWEDGTDLARELLLSQCAHALAAIREPTLQQVWAIDGGLRDCSPDVAEGWRQEYRRIWRGMIDAILTEPAA